MKTVLFFDPNLNERGTSIATYDYANFNETILGNKSIIVSLKNNMLVLYYHVVTQLINIFGFFCLDLFLFVLSETTLRTIQL